MSFRKTGISPVIVVINQTKTTGTKENKPEQKGSTKKVERRP